MYIWFPHNTPGHSSFKGRLQDFEHLGLLDSKHVVGHVVISDSVPVSVIFRSIQLVDNILLQPEILLYVHR